MQKCANSRARHQSAGIHRPGGLPRGMTVTPERFFLASPACMRCHSRHLSNAPKNKPMVKQRIEMTHPVLIFKITFKYVIYFQTTKDFENQIIKKCRSAASLRAAFHPNKFRAYLQFPTFARDFFLHINLFHSYENFETPALCKKNKRQFFSRMFFGEIQIFELNFDFQIFLEAIHEFSQLPSPYLFLMH